nr:unnamed protein product [Callosobruchus analis]
MIRRILNSVVESASQSVESPGFPHPFTKQETLPFSWLTTRAPCFPIKAEMLLSLRNLNSFITFCEAVSICKRQGNTCKSLHWKWILGEEACGNIEDK